MSTQFLSDWDILSTQKFLSDFLAFSKLSTQFLGNYQIWVLSFLAVSKLLEIWVQSFLIFKKQSTQFLSSWKNWVLVSYKRVSN